MNTALAQLSEWRQAGLDLTVAVNISTRDLLQADFVETVLELMLKHEIPGHCLELEVTEGTLMLDMQRTIAELSKLSGANIIVSIDDFGTGYSSLQYLNDLPVSIVKIDRSFVTDLPNHIGKAHIVQAAVNLCRKLDMSVVAEGVETPESYRFLSDIGCDMAQGYLISRPVAARDFVTWYNGLSGNKWQSTFRI